jgi:hypothetical protein
MAGALDVGTPVIVEGGWTGVDVDKGPNSQGFAGEVIEMGVY